MFTTMHDCAIAAVAVAAAVAVVAAVSGLFEKCLVHGRFSCSFSSRRSMRRYRAVVVRGGTSGVGDVNENGDVELRKLLRTRD